jgi:hypothetical protein
MPGSEKVRQAPGEAWLRVVRLNASPAFRDFFAKDVVLEASVIAGACVGVEEVAAFFAASSSGMYESFTFTTEATDGSRTYLEWEGKAFGTDVGGITILTRNLAGRIVNIRLYHRPLPIVRRFSEELSKRLSGKQNPATFK